MLIQKSVQGVVCVMNELLTAMSRDMGIDRYRNESEDSFIYRLCYSALGQWCLRTAQNSSDGIIGTTKNNQTIVLNELMLRYSELFPSVANRYIDISNQQMSVSVHVRRVYEETGYLLTDDNNRNRLANFGRSITISNAALFFGIPNTTYSVTGLGALTNPTAYNISAKEFLIRDDLTWEEYFQSQFDIIDFYDRDISLDELEFFNPLSNNVPSQSWGRQMETDCSVARKSGLGPFYRVMRAADASLQFADEIVEPQSDSYTSYEFRRLYFALKAHYNKPLKATIIKQDAKYSKIRIGGHLPNREYYYLLLLSWPVNSAFDKVNFLLRNDFIPEVTAALTNIGIEVIGGITNA
ncbi:MAG TPA: hypothetical protein VM577_13620 [Anaerovoracaceae bacterium]|nr:hypothetical protein [Anaerovoracaceae bacterium]